MNVVLFGSFDRYLVHFYLNIAAENSWEGNRLVGFVPCEVRGQVVISKVS
jgi:hypothetical protein